MPAEAPTFPPAAPTRSHPVFASPQFAPMIRKGSIPVSMPFSDVDRREFP